MCDYSDNLVLQKVDTHIAQLNSKMGATVSIVLIAWMNGDTSHTASTMGVTKDSFPINFNIVFLLS